MKQWVWVIWIHLVSWPSTIHIFNILYDNIGSIIQHFCIKPKLCTLWLLNTPPPKKKKMTSREKQLCDCLNCELNRVLFFFLRNTIFPWMNYIQADYGYSELASHRHFLQEEWSVTSRKTTGSIYCQWYDLSFHGVSKDVWKTGIYHHELDSLQLFKDFSDEIGGVSNECYILNCIMKCVNTWKICITL